MKKCSLCKEVKPFEEFHRMLSAKDGCQPKCKQCRDKKRPALKEGKMNRDVSDLPNELWRDLKGFEGIYQISNLGRVKSLERKVSDPYPISGYRIIKPSILKVTYASRYPTVRLTLDKRSKNYQMHVLMWVNFKQEPIKQGWVIDHINNDPKDFRLENLQLITQRYNLIKDTKIKRNIGAVPIKPQTENQLPKWDARICINGKKIQLGRYKTEKEAHLRYMEELAKTNDPTLESHLKNRFAE